jgi:hypothetical protein
MSDVAQKEPEEVVQSIQDILKEGPPPEQAAVAGETSPAHPEAETAPPMQHEESSPAELQHDNRENDQPAEQRPEETAAGTMANVMAPPEGHESSQSADVMHGGHTDDKYDQPAFAGAAESGLAMGSGQAMGAEPIYAAAAKEERFVDAREGASGDLGKPLVANIDDNHLSSPMPEETALQETGPESLDIAATNAHMPPHSSDEMQGEAEKKNEVPSATEVTTQSPSTHDDEQVAAPETSQAINPMDPVTEERKPELSGQTDEQPEATESTMPEATSPHAKDQSEPLRQEPLSEAVEEHQGEEQPHQHGESVAPEKEKERSSPAAPAADGGKQEDSILLPPPEATATAAETSQATEQSSAGDAQQMPETPVITMLSMTGQESEKPTEASLPPSTDIPEQVIPHEADSSQPAETMMGRHEEEAKVPEGAAAPAIEEHQPEQTAPATAVPQDSATKSEGEGSNGEAASHQEHKEKRHKSILSSLFHLGSKKSRPEEAPQSDKEAPPADAEK